MNFIKKVYRKLCDTTYRITRMIKIILQSFVYKNKVYLFGIPIHGNLGDQAILLAEEKFLQNNLEDIKKKSDWVTLLDLTTKIIYDLLDILVMEIPSTM